MGQSEKEKKKAPQPVVVVVVAAMSKEVELEAFNHEHVLEEREEALSFGRERGSFENVLEGLGNRFLIRKF